GAPARATAQNATASGTAPARSSAMTRRANIAVTSAPAAATDTVSGRAGTPSGTNALATATSAAPTSTASAAWASAGNRGPNHAARPAPISARYTSAPSGMTRSSALLTPDRCAPPGEGLDPEVRGGRARPADENAGAVVLSGVDEREGHRERVGGEQRAPAPAYEPPEKERDQHRVGGVQRRHGGDVVRVARAVVPGRAEVADRRRL